MTTTTHKLIGAAVGVLVMVGPAHAATSQRVSTTRAVKAAGQAQARAWRHHDRRMHSWAIQCSFSDIRGKRPHRTGRIETCDFRVYRTTRQTGILVILKLDVDVIRHVRHPHIEEDGSGTGPYSQARSLRFNTTSVVRA